MKRIPRLEEAPAFQALLFAIEQRVRESLKKEYSYQVCVETLFNNQTIATLKWSKAKERVVERMLLDLQHLRFHTEDSVRLRTFGIENHRDKPKKPLIAVVSLINVIY